MTAPSSPQRDPYGVVTDKDGNSEIQDLPAGKHTFTIWHESAGVIDSQFQAEISGEGQDFEATIEVDSGNLVPQQ